MGKRILEKYGLYFDGNDNVNFGNVLNLNNKITVEAVVRPRTYHVAGWACIADKFGLAGSRAYMLAFGPSPGDVRFNINGTTTTIGTTSPLPLNRIYHVAGVYDRINVMVYINAVLNGSTPYNLAITVIPNPFRVGARSDLDAISYLIGDVFCVRVYNRDLTPAELRNNMLGQISMTGLQLWAQYNEGRGAVLHDYSGNNNHGTIVGATWVKAPRKAIRFG